MTELSRGRSSLLFAMMLLLIVATPVAGGHRDDAVRFAVQYFDPEHKLGITRASKEFNYMFGAMHSVRKLNPHLFRTVNRVMSLAPAECASLVGRVTEFNAVQITRHPPVDRDYIDSLINLVERTIGGCGRKRVTIEDPWIGTKVVTQYFFPHLHDTSRVDLSIPERLRKLGFYSAILDFRRGRAPKASLYFVTRQETDMDYLARRVAEDTVLGREFSGFLPTRFTTTVVGDGDWVSLDNPAGEATYGAILHFRYARGWGDCPAGCTQQHVWHVEVTPKEISGKWTFEAEIVAETGDSLPSMPANVDW